MAPCSHSLLLRVAWLLLVNGAGVRAHGRMFVLQPKNGTMQWDISAAQGLCVEQGARLATAEELQRAVDECAFTECTSGWIADNQIGSTVCSDMGFGQQDRQNIHVKTESASSGGRYDSFCIKDQGSPCGDPPSFPNTVLQGYSGTEMGDELLYICAQGYIMANGENAFSLLCDSCGEWYGFVQACVKDEAEGHIDYEDKFSNEDSLSFSDPAEEQGKEEVKAPDDGLDETADGSIGEGSRETMRPNESPVSLLSQKQLFWFPSEAFPGVEQLNLRKADVESKMLTPASNNQIAVKTEDEGERTGQGEEVPIGPSIVQNETKVTKETIAGTNKSWVDGYPGVSDTVEEKIDGSMEAQVEAPDTTDHVNQVEISRTGTPSSTLANHHTQPMTAPTGLPVIDSKQVDIVQTLAPEDASVSRGAELDTTTSLGTLSKMPWKSSDVLTEPSLPPTDTGETVSEGLYPAEQAPVSTAVAGLTTHYTAVTAEASAQTLIDLSDLDMFDDFTKRGTFSDGFEAKLLPTVRSCRGQECSSSNHGPMIATIVTVVSLLSLAVILAAWCYKHRHQKTSVYELNGKGHMRCGERIEMQQRV
ncbi:sushi domain-containing protein 5 [Leucoraja erinacea]|uniref:sushi domain-containing protein 5 n=1 Tax=Leucoraja erinaceus TaxID=7782 RepID=UPI002456ADCA|nr:sushi domain-containing protein 5 [Leucoraja erinacea]